jgi:hypothetical protein
MFEQDRNAVNICGGQDADLFDPVTSTTSNLPHLMELLLAEYRTYLTSEIEKKQAAGQRTISIAEALTVAPFNNFFNFCVRYLTINRPVENFFVDMNHGLKLSNNVSVVVCPGVNPQGQMEDSGAVNITTGLSQPGTRDGYQGNEVRIF